MAKSHAVYKTHTRPHTETQEANTVLVTKHKKMHLNHTKNQYLVFIRRKSIESPKLTASGSL